MASLGAPQRPVQCARRSPGTANLRDRVADGVESESVTAMPRSFAVRGWNVPEQLLSIVPRQIAVEEFEHGLFLHDRLIAGNGQVATTRSQVRLKASDSSDFAERSSPIGRRPYSRRCGLSSSPP
jgi:hypothetical protein